MQIQINDETYTVSEDAREQLFAWLFAEGSAQQQKFKEKHSAWYFTIKTLVRGMLQWFEEKVPTEHRLKFRPEKGQNPLDLAQERLIDLLRNSSERYTLRITTNESRELTAFSFIANPGESGGPVDSHGDQRVGQDDGAEVSGRGLREALPDESALCAG